MAELLPTVGQMVLFHRPSYDYRQPSGNGTPCPAVITKVYPLTGDEGDDGTRRVALVRLDAHAGGSGTGTEPGPVRRRQGLGQWEPLPAQAGARTPAGWIPLGR
jgi:hypothetical protein